MSRSAESTVDVQELRFTWAASCARLASSANSECRCFASSQCNDGCSYIVVSFRGVQPQDGGDRGFLPYEKSRRGAGFSLHPSRCAGEDLNLHGPSGHKALNLARLPIPPPARGDEL